VRIDWAIVFVIAIIVAVVGFFGFVIYMAIQEESGPSWTILKSEFTCTGSHEQTTYSSTYISTGKGTGYVSSYPITTTICDQYTRTNKIGNMGR